MKRARVEPLRRVLPLPVEVRPCRREDLEPLEWLGLHRDHREIVAQAFAARARGENLMLVADVHGFPVGQAWVDLVKRRRARAGVIWAVRVFPPLRGLGIGTLLIRSAERHARAHGCRAAEIGVERTNPRARALYERLGYELAGALAEPWSYTTPEGRRVDAVADLLILRRALEDPPDADPARRETGWADPPSE